MNDISHFDAHLAMRRLKDEAQDHESVFVNVFIFVKKKTHNLHNVLLMRYKIIIIFSPFK